MSHRTVHIAIGNSDDKLTQAEWSDYCHRVSRIVQEFAVTIHGSWFSRSDDPWQNACWAFTILPYKTGHAKERLIYMAARFRQDSVSWNESETRFLCPVPSEAPAEQRCPRCGCLPSVTTGHPSTGGCMVELRAEDGA